MPCLQWYSWVGGQSGKYWRCHNILWEQFVQHTIRDILGSDDNVQLLTEQNSISCLLPSVTGMFLLVSRRALLTLHVVAPILLNILLLQLHYCWSTTQKSRWASWAIGPQRVPFIHYRGLLAAMCGVATFLLQHSRHSTFLGLCTSILLLLSLL